MISKEQIIGFEASTRLFGQHAKGVNVAIDVVTDPIAKTVWFQLTDCHRPIYTGPCLDTAINIFNDIVEGAHRS